MIMRIFLTMVLVAVAGCYIWAVWLVSQTGTMGETSFAAVGGAAGLAWWLWHLDVDKWK